MKKKDSLKFVTAAVIVVLVFLLGFLLGRWVASKKLSELVTTRTELSNLLIGLDLKDQIIENELCNLPSDYLLEERTKIGRKLDLIEKRFGKSNPDVAAEKEIYQLIETKVMLLMEKVKNNCNKDFHIILFFYTNEEKDVKGSVDECVLQGLALDELYKRHKEKINTFAFDVNNQNPALTALRQKYNVQRAPTVIIDKEKYEGLRTRQELEQLLEL